MFVKSIQGTQYSYDLRRNRICRDEAGRPGDANDEVATTGRMLMPFDTEMLKKVSEKSIAYLSITITEVCNMRCKYCTYSGGFEGHRVHSGRSMSLENGMKILDWFYRHSENVNPVRLGFYGGEVLSNLQVLKGLTEYAKNKFGDKLKEVFFTTNGTLLTKDVIEWIAQNPKLKVSITLNGSSETHDRNRILASGSPSHRLILANIESLARRMGDSFPSQISFLANYKDFRERREILSYFDDNEILRVSSVLCTPIDYPPDMLEGRERSLEKEDDDLFRRQEEELAIRKLPNDTFETYGRRLAAAGIKPDVLVKYHARHEGIADKLYFQGGCIPFANRMAVDLLGDLHFCEGTDYLSPIGNALRDEVYVDALDRLQRIEQLLNDGLECRKCPAANFCELCFRDFLCKDGVKKPDEVRKACSTMKEKFMHDMKMYVSVREEFPEFLDSLVGDSHSEGVRNLIKEAVKRKEASEEIDKQE